MEVWDPNEWQGRSREKIENNYKVMGYTFFIFIVVSIIFVIYKLIKIRLNL